MVLKISILSAVRIQNYFNYLVKVCFSFTLLLMIRERNLDYKTPLHEKRKDGLCYTRRKTNLDVEIGQTEAAKFTYKNCIAQTT